MTTPREDACVRCGQARDRGIHDTAETCEEVRGPCLDPASHHPFVPPTTPRDTIAALRAVAEAARALLKAPIYLSFDNPYDERLEPYEATADALAALDAVEEPR